MANDQRVIIDTLNGRAHRVSQIIAVVALAIAGVATSSAAEEVLPRALVVEKNSRTLSAISFQDGSLRKSAEFRRKPKEILVSPDASRAVVVTESEKGSRNMLYFIDTKSLAALGSTTLNGDLGSYVTKEYLGRDRVQGWWNSNSTRFTLLIGGGLGGKLDSRLVQIDATNGAIVGQITLAKKAEATITGLVVKQAKRLALRYLPVKHSRMHGVVPDEKQTAPDLLLVDLDELNATKRIAIPGNVVYMWLGEDGKYLQVEYSTAGKDKTASLSLSSISCDRWAEVWKDDGRAGYAFANSLTPDETLIGIRGLGHESTLLALRGDQVSQRLTLPDAPRSIRVSTKTKRAYVTCSESLQVVDLLTFKIVGSVSTPHLHPSFWSSGSGDSRALELILTNSEDRGYLTYEGDDEISALDLRNFALIKTFRLESDLSKFEKAMLSAAVAGAMAGLATVGTNAAGVPGMWVVTNIPLPPSYAPRAVALSKDERILYLLRPDGVSMVDTDQLRRTKVLLVRDGIKALPPALMLTNDLESSNRLTVAAFATSALTGEPDSKKVVVNTFDAVSGERLTDAGVPRYGFSYLGGGKYVMDHDGNVVRLWDAKSFEVLKSVEATGSIVQLVGIEN